MQVEKKQRPTINFHCQTAGSNFPLICYCCAWQYHWLGCNKAG